MKNLVKLTLACTVAIGAIAQDSAQRPPDPGQAAAAGQGQEHREYRGGMRPFGNRVMGEIIAVSPDGFTVKDMAGKTTQVKVNSDTRLMRNREPIKLTDFKVGTSVMAAGNPDPKDASVIDARFVVDNTEQMKEFKENLGKTMIAGEVKSIDGTKLTILRPDGQTQVIEADENTSFQKGRDSITLADIKPGDHVMGRGQVKDGTFVPSTLRVGGMGGGAMMFGPRGDGQSRQGQIPNQQSSQPPSGGQQPQ